MPCSYPGSGLELADPDVDPPLRAELELWVGSCSFFSKELSPQGCMAASCHGTWIQRGNLARGISPNGQRLIYPPVVSRLLMSH